LWHKVKDVRSIKLRKKPERSDDMSENQKRIIEAVAEALPHMSDFDKGYMLGMAESNSGDKEQKQEESE
jgi:uncharacterized damage-inducible protein DinB